MIIRNETTQVLLDCVVSGRLSRRRFLAIASAAGLVGGLPPALVDQALAAGETQAANQAKLKAAYDYIVEVRALRAPLSRASCQRRAPTFC